MKPYNYHRSKRIIRKMYELQAAYMRLHEQLEILREPRHGTTIIERRQVALTDLDERQLMALHLAARRDLELLGREIRQLGETISSDNAGAIAETARQHVPEPDRVRRHRGRKARREARSNLMRKVKP